MRPDNLTIREDDDKVIAHGIGVFEDYGREPPPYFVISKRKPLCSTVCPHLSPSRYSRDGEPRRACNSALVVLPASTEATSRWT